MFRIKFWGVRGSIPSPGPATARIGGNTSCVEVNAGDTLIILDAGTGIRMLGDELMKKKAPVNAYMFFSHVHWDHIQGFPFFSPIFLKQNKLFVYGGKNLKMTLGETLAGQMNFPNFPVTLETCSAEIQFHQFDDGQKLELAEGLTITGLPLQHPNGCYGYRIEYKGSSFTYCTDTEQGGDPDKPDENVLELAKDTDLFVYDSQYTVDEYTGNGTGIPKIGWGHSTYNEAARLASLANAKKLIMFHHDPSHDDDKIEEMEKECQKLFPATEAAREGREYIL
jgi:phosphoribosyl 1,2-cyclic phosphodiesterase